ncbi:MAG: hypothetical protein IPP43_03595 [Chitinophagaceae bacterium]|nr:hypothetical protein [Chitinophagaceae bacterium]
MMFAFFALGGTIRLFKTFYHFYPKLYRELALACLFLPSVCYWSSGLLKDPICLGAVGYITYAFLNLFVKKEKYLISIAWIVACGFLLYIIKIYILLVLVLSLLIWQFAEFNKLIENKSLRSIFSIMTFAGSIMISILMLNYFTSMEAGQQYQMDKIKGNAEYQREMFAMVSQQSGEMILILRSILPIRF